MFKYASPESLGISSLDIKSYIECLEERGLSTHDVIIMKNGTIVYENYWAPFNKDFHHRMYSVTKSFVSLAIGCLIEEGKLSLDDKIVDVLPEEITCHAGKNVKKQTIRDMLMMATGFPAVYGNFFIRHPEDRLLDYFKSSSDDSAYSREPGTYFEYDSFGSFVLGALAEKLSGKKLKDYLMDKFMREIGFSEESYILTCPGGHSWGDSALICKPTDLLKAANFVMHYGNHEGKQLMDAAYLKEATSNLIDVHKGEGYGYGYQFWTLPHGCFYFNGMGCQFAICCPEKDMILIYNGDNQGVAWASQYIIDNYFEKVLTKAGSSPLPENEKAQKDLLDYSEKLILYHCKGKNNSFSKEINGKTFVFDENTMGLKKLSFAFSGDEGKLTYTNERGEKTLSFGFDKNIFAPFPESGYANMTACKYEDDYYMASASSGTWTDDKKLYISTQIIDKYFGRLHMNFDFSEEGKVLVSMQKTAEDFLWQYQGEAEGVLEK